MKQGDAVLADIFISYSKQDQAEARLLAAFLEAEGYSVWWDTSLLSGDKFRKVLMEELAKARAAIVIWTESSVKSDWVMSEAGRAHEKALAIGSLKFIGRKGQEIVGRTVGF